MICEFEENPLTVTPQSHGEGMRDSHRANDRAICFPSSDAHEKPLTLTLSPQSRGEGMRDDLDSFGFVRRFVVSLSRLFRAMVLSFGVGLLFVGDFASGQAPVTTPRSDDFSTTKPTASKKLASKTTVVEFELLQASGGGGLFAQHWLKVLQPLDVSLHVRRPVLDDKPELKEREAGNIRYVTAIGTLDRSGAVSFPNKTFAVGDSVKLKEWIDELRTYGARGTPAGQPLWGLTNDQFAHLFDSLLKPVDIETENRPLSTAIAKFPLPSEFPLRWNAEASERLAVRGERAKVRQELKGFSVAMSLSLALKENGFGFRPNRTPRGDLELLVEPLNPKLEQWPVGWPVQRATFKAAPKLYAMVPIELTDVDLSDVISAISELAETPVLIDYAELDAKKIDLDKIKVSFPRKMTTWSLALRQVVVPQRLTRELWQDEAGRVFVWITTTRAGRVKDQ